MIMTKISVGLWLSSANKKIIGNVKFGELRGQCIGCVINISMKVDEYLKRFFLFPMTSVSFDFSKTYWISFSFLIS